MEAPIAPLDPLLAKAADTEAGRAILDLFAAEPDRVDASTLRAAGLTFDFSKQRVSAAARDALIAFAHARGLPDQRDAMFAGDIVNATEGRAALHTALRGASLDARANAEAAAGRDKARAFADAFRDDRTLGGGAPINAIVHLGIGGSDLGPRLVYEALADNRAADIQVRFAANIDPAELNDALAGLDPARTFVCVVSKTFTTQETMANAAVARAWLERGAGPAVAGRRLAAITAAPERAIAWGAPAEQVFPFWEWVGGRYSVWSAVSLSVEMALQPGAFDGFLAGAAAMDAAFRTAPPERNPPLMAALISHWNREALHAASTATAPYAHRLGLLPAWLQQLEMESNGKRVRADGALLAGPAAGVTWGGTGSVAQHSFFQLLHQGAQTIPVDFIAVAAAMGEPHAHHRALLANALAQAQALLCGKDETAVRAELAAAGFSADEIDALAPHKTFPGDRPSSLIALEALTPETLGALLAFFEHRTVAQAWLAGVNPFDQWGVELGKAMARSLDETLAPGAPTPPGLDPSTTAWVARLRGEGA